MAQIKDVAKQAGVSVASVSRVLTGHAGVSEATRQRVLEAVQALDYRPDLAARRLRSRRTDTIGLIVSDIRNPFFTEVSRAVEDVAYQHRMRVILCNADEDPEKEALYLDLMRDENVSGVILSPTLPRLARFRPSDYSFPVVLVDRCERETAADAVVLDNVDAAYRLTAHLIAQGHRRIGFIYGATSATGRQRQEGYVTAMATHGLETQAQAVPATVDAARAVASEWVSRRPLPDALVGSNGLILLGLVEALREAHLRFPAQIALAGFDDLPWTRLVEPGITVIAQPTYDLGQAAIELLLQRIAHPAQSVRRVVLRGELVERGSSAMWNA
jgi:LacI family fructose operon transcriptional repressor